MKELYEKASSLAGREVEVEKTKDGKFVVVWFDANLPPPKGDSEEDALKLFITKLEGRAPLPEEVLKEDINV
jgi:hypothetical protein